MARGKRAESRCRYLVRDIASQKGWDTSHPQKGGDFLEEQEIEDFLPDCGLSGTKPDFLVCHKNIPLLVVEAKNDRKKISQALKEAIGVAGEEDHGYIFKTVYWDGKTWEPLSSRGFELTSFPGVSEIEGALLTNNGTTEVTLPEGSEYIDTAFLPSAISRSQSCQTKTRKSIAIKSRDLFYRRLFALRILQGK